jgi:MATE family multidrug resistance protein
VIPSFGRESRTTLALALPLIAGQVGQMLMGVADTVIVGRVGVVELGAATFANTLTSVPYVIGIGLLTSISVRISNARGGGDKAEALSVFRHGTWLALIYGLIVAGLTFALLPFLHWFGQAPEVTARAFNYLLIVAASLVPALLSMAWKNHADALNQPWPGFWILMGGVGLNVLLNWMWIYGKMGFPAWGLEGAAFATLAARTATAVALIVWLSRSRVIGDWSRPKWLARLQPAAFRDLLKIGFPASLHLLTEVSAFAAAALMIGTLGAAALAAHQVALTCAATTFMVPLGVAMALTVRMGEIAGAGEYRRMRRVLVGGWIYGLVFMCASALVFLLAGPWLARQFVTDIAVIEAAAQLLIVAGVFQLFDGMQVVSGGALRGIGDVRVPAIYAFVAYWLVALPVGYIFMKPLGWGAPGVWSGLAGGLAVAGFALGIRAWRRLGPHDARNA